jgi:hypothetical protein
MAKYGLIAAVALAWTLQMPAHACRADADLELADVRYADVVIVGLVSDYSVITPTQPMRRSYARYKVQIDQVLKGSLNDKTLWVTWDNSTFAFPESIDPGPLLIALRRPASPIPPLRGPSATISPSPEGDTLTVLQAPCSSPFMFDSRSSTAGRVRQLLGR